MSGEREARILGAAETIEVEGEVYKLRPVKARHLADLEREALKFYKQQVLSTYGDNAKLLGDRAVDIIAKKMDEVSNWDLSTLPQRDAYDVSAVPVTDALRERIVELFEDDPEYDQGYRVLLLNALDTGRITSEEVKQLTGKRPLKGRVRYDQWWVSGSMEGITAFVTSSVTQDHPRMNREKVQKWPFQKLCEAANIIERITVADMGNT